MTRIAPIAATIYALAILVASLAPHCDWMFPVESAPQVYAAASEHGTHATDHGSSRPKPERDCASMEMAKSVAPLPAVLALAAPDVVAMPVLAVPLQHGVASPQLMVLALPRAPPRTIDGFAAVFAANHRLLI